MSELAAIADAVLAEVNGHTFALPFTAVRTWWPRYDREDMKTLHVTVAPRGFQRKFLTRTQDQVDYLVDVAVQKAVDPASNATIDPLAGLVESIGEFFRGRRPATYTGAACVSAAFAPGCEHGFLEEHMNTLRQFTSILTLTFRVVR